MVMFYPVSSLFEVLGILNPFFKEGFKPPEARTFSMFLSRIRINIKKGCRALSDGLFCRPIDGGGVDSLPIGPCFVDEKS